MTQRVLGRSEPLALVARCELDEVGQDAGGPLVRVLLRDRSEPREICAGAMGSEAVTAVGLVDHAGRQQDVLAQAVDVLVAGPWASAALRVADGIGPVALRREGLHPPALVGPEALGIEHVQEHGLVP